MIAVIFGNTPSYQFEKGVLEMDNVLQRINELLFPAEKETAPPLPTVEEELALLRLRIEAAESRFNTATGEGEIDAAVYDLNALETRYNLLVRRVKSGEE